MKLSHAHCKTTLCYSHIVSLEGTLDLCFNEGFLSQRISVWCCTIPVLLVKALKRICCRCGATYFVSQTGKHIRQEECNYHYGKGVKNKGECTLVKL